MRPIPADSLGHAHGLLRAIDKRGRLRTDEFVTEFSLDELFPPDLENALGRMRHFISYARAAGLVKEDRGVVELTEVGRRYIRSGEADRPFAVGPQQAEWLRRQLREKHMTDSIFHGLAIGLSLLASTPPPTRIATIDFGRSMAYLGRAGWDNENTLEIQGERHLILLQDMELIDGEHRLTPTGELVRGELTLPVHMSLPDIAAQLNPGGADAVRAAAEAEFAEPVAAAPVVEQAAVPEPEDDEDDDDNGYHTVVGGIEAVSPPKAEEEVEPPRPPIVPRAAASPLEDADEDEIPALTSGDPLASSVAPPAAEPEVVYPPPVSPVDTPTIITPGTTPAASQAPAASVPEASAAPPAPAGAPPHVAPASAPPPSAPADTPPYAAPASVPEGSAAPPVSPTPAEAPPHVAPPSAPEASTAPPVPAEAPQHAAPAGVPEGSAAPPVSPPPAEAPPHAAPASTPEVSVAPPVSPTPAEAPPHAAPAGVPEVSAAPPVSPAPAVAPPQAAPEGSAAPPVSPTPAEAPPHSAPPSVPEVSATPPVSPAPVEAPPAVAPTPPAASVAPPVAPAADMRRAAPASDVFVEAWAVRAAAEAAGLRLADSVYANVAAALNAGKHLVLTGAPGSGKTTLALAVARAAAQAGHAHGATVVTGAPAQQLLTEAAARGRWVIADELDQADADATLKPLSTLLGGVPVTLDGEEAEPARGWRIVATWNGSPPRGASVLRRFAAVDVARPPMETLRALLAQDDPQAKEAVETLLALGLPLGAGVLIEAANHIRTRQAAVATDAGTLADEAVAAYISPLLDL